MAIGHISKSTIDSFYDKASSYLEDSRIGEIILSRLNLVFMISQSYEVEDLFDFLSGRNLPIVEAFEDMNASYELIRMGLTKQAFATLRSGLNNGLLAAYWTAFGDTTEEFQRWLQSKEETPRKDSAFWTTISSVDEVSKFLRTFPMRPEIEDLEDLSNYVHTRGAAYATLMDFQRQVKSGNRFVDLDKWVDRFCAVVRIAIILQMLVRPPLAVVLPDDLLLRKFGTFDRVPSMGALIGDFSSSLQESVGEKEYAEIKQLALQTAAAKDVQQYVDSFPDLSDAEIRSFVIQEQKQRILELGFGQWMSNRRLFDHRIDDKMVMELRAWTGEHGSG